MSPTHPQHTRMSPTTSFFDPSHTLITPSRLEQKKEKRKKLLRSLLVEPRAHCFSLPVLRKVNGRGREREEGTGRGREGRGEGGREGERKGGKGREREGRMKVGGM